MWTSFPSSATKILYEWIMSEEGQRLAAHEGYVSAMDVGGDAP